MIARICRTCDKEFFITLGDFNEGRGKFCSRECAWNRPKSFNTELVLELWYKGASANEISCHKDITASPMTIRRWLQKQGIYQKRHASGEKIGKWSGGHRNYREKTITPDSACEICGYNKYISVLVVHHKDRNRRNSSPSNLQVLCPTHHVETHYLENTGVYTPKRGGQIQDAL